MHQDLMVKAAFALCGIAAVVFVIVVSKWGMDK